MDKSRVAVRIFDRCAQTYQDKFMDVSLYHDSLDLFCQALQSEGATILELACGPGNITRYLLQKRPDFKILATDLSAKMLELARRNNPAAEFQIMDCRNMTEADGRYDAVVNGFGLPYLSKEEALKWIGDVAGVLNANGLLYLSTMEDDYDKSGWQGPSSGGPERMYIHYHEAGYLLEALRKKGFEILRLHREEYRGSDGALTRDLVIVARRHC